jgi:AraC-like DNA-binding protein
MLQLASELGVSAADSTAGTGLTQDELKDPSREIEGRQELAVLRNILRALGPDVPFALLAGQRYHLSTHGMWGFAIMSSPNLGAAMEMGLRYFDLSFSFNRVSVEVDERTMYLLYDSSDNPDDLQSALIERDLAFLVAGQRELIGRAAPARSLELRRPRPRYADMFEPLFGAAPQFDTAVDRLGFDPAVLTVVQPLADELGLRVCEQQCRALIEQRRARSGLSGKVRARIVSNPGEFPSMQTIAAELAMTTRTMRNQLAREGTSYRELVEGLRATLAEELLATSRLSVDQIAERLGYADTSSFTMAFKRWKGVSPRGFKRGRAAASGAGSRAS